MLKIFKNMFNFEKKRLNEIEEIAKKVEALSEEYKAYSDEQLKEKTTEFRNRVANGETLDDILVEAYATVREASLRAIGQYPYFVQIMGGIVLHQGDIAEMKTGEGKTLTSVFPVYLNALEGKGVHIVTVNEYLSERDANWMGDIHRFLGLTVGVNLRSLTPKSKRDAYNCDITYTTNSELGFDYLRDNMVTDVSQRVLRGLNFTLVDEVDSILIDESRTPLIISGGKKQTANIYMQVDKFVKKLKENVDFEIEVKSKTIQLTEEGVDKAESAFKINNLYDVNNTALVHHINMSLKANFIMFNDVEYVVKDGAIVIVDQFTGRLMEGRAYSDGLHQAIEAKEGVKIKEETVTLATITYQNFFRLYQKIAGMTGTAKTEEEEFLAIYNMRVVEIPTNKPVVRDDRPDYIFATQKAKYKMMIDSIIEVHETKQPILVGTISVEVSELVSKMLTQRKIKHQVLNAKNHGREADIIARAGELSSVTIATNMAGRGTDIKLGEGVVELGGLAVFGSERHDSRRIDNQLRGRSGRQGDPGFSQFFVSFEDELMVRYGSDKNQLLKNAMGEDAVASKMFSKAIESAQKRVEGQNFDVRKSLLEYDDVLRQQREIMYDQRNYILDNDDISELAKEMFNRIIANNISANTNSEGKTEVIDYEAVIKSFEVLGSSEGILVLDQTYGKDKVQLSEYIFNNLYGSYNLKIAPIKDRFAQIEKEMLLRVVDRAWIDHIDTMSKLREGIHLRSYAQTNPLQEYIAEGYQLFEEMMQRISSDFVSFALKVQFRVEEK